MERRGKNCCISVWEGVLTREARRDAKGGCSRLNGREMSSHGAFKGQRSCICVHGTIMQGGRAEAPEEAEETLWS